MPRSRRTYWLYPDLDSASARRRNRRNSGVELGIDWDAYGVARTVHRPAEVRPRNHEQLHYQYKVSRDQANLVSSNVDGKEGMHMPCLDLDIPHKYVPSSTEGHGHLYLDVEVPEDKYFALLDLLGECGILEPGYVRASKAKGGTYLRPEGVKKKVRKTEEVPARDPRTSAPSSEVSIPQAGLSADGSIYTLADSIVYTRPVSREDLLEFVETSPPAPEHAMSSDDWNTYLNETGPTVARGQEVPF